ncbi:hypothetical protein SKAU_G00367630 [Synaphobranchus kaupii]|uniref:Uncharacterized protein n=1 Tax=Synaphobranchus kaupii TaxID=118154 RepID=A0A9Q1EFG4_SYNKA|nr:hypothetical protein SKAU_G00367630 [Synaphobranchus kaupii]
MSDKTAEGALLRRVTPGKVIEASGGRAEAYAGGQAAAERHRDSRAVVQLLQGKVLKKTAVELAAMVSNRVVDLTWPQSEDVLMAKWSGLRTDARFRGPTTTANRTDVFSGKRYL